MSHQTRDQFLTVAARQFAEKGFYGTSIAAVADELGLTKQALLHHFGSKEKLYGEILQGISQRSLATLETLRASDDPPQAQLEAVLIDYFRSQIEQPDAARLLMRELLDNEQRAEKAGNWYLKPYLEALIDTVLAIEHTRHLSRAQALALVYQLLGAANYITVSQPTLKQMFGEADFRATLISARNCAA